MDESVLLTFDDVKFIQGETKMNQSNWQSYFGGALKNGVYSGLDVNKSQMGVLDNTGASYVMNDGIIYVNGICAKIETETGYTNFGRLNSAIADQFVCARVYFNTETIELIQKTDITDISSGTLSQKRLALMKTLMEFENDESYCCERNSEYWEIPLFYRTKNKLTSDSDSKSWLFGGVDLTRRPAENSKLIRLMTNYNTTSIAYQSIDANPISGNNSYYVEQVGDHNQHNIYMDTVNEPHGAVAFLDNTSTLVVHLYRVPYTIWRNTDSSGSGFGIQTFDSIYEIKYKFSNPSDWTLSSDGLSYLYTAPNNTCCLKFTCLSKDYNYSQGYGLSWNFLVEVIP